MSTKIIFENLETRAYEHGSLVAINTEMSTSQDIIPMSGRHAVVLMFPEEIDAIHAAIHEGDELEPVEACCGNCFHAGKFYDGFADCYRYPPIKAECKVGDTQRACGEHRPKE